MYLSHYELAEKPFQISPDPKFLWLGEKHREALAALEYGIINNQGFVLLTGDVGTGKTTLVNALCDKLSDDVIVATVPDPIFEKLEFFNFVADCFNFGKKFDNKLDFLIYFRDFLIRSYHSDLKVILIIDESHRISTDLLEQLRLFSNIETNNAKLLSIFFVGQNEFNTILLDKDNRALRQRIAITYNIDPLTPRETKEYIDYRLKIAGTRREIFTPRAIRQIYSFSGGYPRLINIMCDHALLTGYVKDLKRIEPKLIKECAHELSLPGETWHCDVNYSVTAVTTRRTNRLRWPVYGMLLLLTIITGYLSFAGEHSEYLTNIRNYYGGVFKHIQVPLVSHEREKSYVLQSDLGPDLSSTLTRPESSNMPPPLTGKAPSARYPTTQSEADAIDRTDRVSDVAQPGLGSDLTQRRLVVPFHVYTNTVPEDAYTLMDSLAAAMLDNVDLNVVVQGYTDTSGNPVQNRRLSTYRANSVKIYLVDKGVDPERIEATGMGEANPLQTNATAAGRAANRRVEIQLF